MKKLLFLAVMLIAVNLSAQKTQIIKLQGENTLLITNDTIVSVFGKHDKIKYDFITHFEKEGVGLSYTGKEYAVYYIPNKRIEILTDGKRNVFYVTNN
jgi:hypothetical protein